MLTFWPPPRPTEGGISSVCVSTVPAMESEKHLSLRIIGLSDYLLTSWRSLNSWWGYFFEILSPTLNVLLFGTSWTSACQAPMGMGFPRQENWCGLPFPSPGDLPNPGVKFMFLVSPALAGEFLTNSTTWEALPDEEKQASEHLAQNGSPSTTSSGR